MTLTRGRLCHCAAQQGKIQGMHTQPPGRTGRSFAVDSDVGIVRTTKRLPQVFRQEICVTRVRGTLEAQAKKIRVGRKISKDLPVGFTRSLKGQQECRKPFRFSDRC